MFIATTGSSISISDEFICFLSISGEQHNAAARIHSRSAGPVMMQNTIPPLAFQRFVRWRRKGIMQDRTPHKSFFAQPVLALAHPVWSRSLRVFDLHGNWVLRIEAQPLLDVLILSNCSDFVSQLLIFVDDGSVTKGTFESIRVQLRINENGITVLFPPLRDLVGKIFDSVL